MKVILSFVLSSVLVVLVTFIYPFSNAQATCSENTYTGAICWTAASFCPVGFYYANGQMINGNDQRNTPLYGLLGHTYGGYLNTQLFMLPDLMGKTTVGLGTLPSDPYIQIIQGRDNGSDQWEFDEAWMPAHSHAVSLPTKLESSVKASTTASSNNPSSSVPATLSGGGPITKPYGAPSENVTMADDVVSFQLHNQISGTTSSVGEEAAVSLQAPRIGLTPCIKWDYPYPVRN